MDEENAVRRLVDENRRLKQRVAEIEELVLKREEAPDGAGAGHDGLKADVARLLKLLGQKDKILEAYATEIERKAGKLRATVDELRRRNEELAQGGIRLRVLEAVAEELPEAVLGIDAGGRLVYANRAARALFGGAPAGAEAPDAAAALQRAAPGLAEDLRAAAGGAAPPPRSVTVGGKRHAVRIVPLRDGADVKGAVARLSPEEGLP